jgi:uncharacterized protein (TIGR00299 family) protein
MRIAYLECFAGIAGDMFLGALVDAGVDPVMLQKTADSLGLGVVLNFGKVDRSGIQSTKARVLVDGVDAELAHGGGEDPNLKSEMWGTQVSHEHGHTHSHTHAHTHPQEHSHGHGRSLPAIRKLIEGASLTANAKRVALDAFAKLGAAEAKVHGVPIEDVHFHEVGAVDAIVDIVCSAAGADALDVEQWYCSAVNTGSGFVDCAHGRFPVPAPATLELLRGVPVYAEGPAKEFTTPTGAALIAALRCRFNAAPPFVCAGAGYGAGARNPEGFPNVLRLRIGEVQSGEMQVPPLRFASVGMTKGNDTVAVLESAMDDATPEMLAFAAHTLLEHGALDVMQQAAYMKKGRQGTLFTVICRPEDAGHMEHLLFRETTTLGVRIRQEARSVLERRSVEVRTEFGEIRVKLGLRDGAVINAAPEFEDCRKAAQSHGVALKQVMQAAMAAYLEAEAHGLRGSQKAEAR